MTIPRPTLVPAVVAVVLLALAGCAPGNAAPGGGSDSDSGADDAGSGGSTSAGCDDADLSGGWQLFVDDALTVTPAPDGVLSLQTAADSISFVFAAQEEYTTYGYSLGYIDDGTVFPNDSGILFPDGHPDAPDDNVFTVAGPMAPSGVDGGPYAGVLQIDRTDSTGTEIIASICVALAMS